MMKKLTKIQKQLRAPKDKYNSFGKYAYRSAEGILEAVKPLCAEQDCQLTLSDEIVLSGNRFYVCATATLVDNESGEVVNVKAFAREDESKKGMDGSQITGTASSYARKYALNGLFCIDDAKDADTDEYQRVQGSQVDYDKAIASATSSAGLKKIWAEVKAIAGSQPQEYERLKILIANKNKELSNG